MFFIDFRLHYTLFNDIIIVEILNLQGGVIMFKMMNYRKEDASLLPKGVDLRCECAGYNFATLDNFDIINDKYAVLKDGITITCSKCGKSQSAPDKYIFREEDSAILPNHYAPQCPACRSYSVEKIGTMKKYASFVALGIFSSNLGKQFHCKSCGYKF